jgi:hypothetical protein
MLCKKCVYISFNVQKNLHHKKNLFKTFYYIILSCFTQKNKKKVEFFGHCKHSEELSAILEGKNSRTMNGLSTANSG